MQKEKSIQTTNKINSEQVVSADNLLYLVAEICDELHPRHNFRNSISLDSALDTELGLDSLSRMELVHRIENKFQVSLSDRALALMETPRDFLRELEGLGSRKNIKLNVNLGKAEQFETTITDPNPHNAKTLNEILTWQSEHNASIPHIHILGENEQTEVITYSDLFTDARELATGLLVNELLPGETVLLMLPTSREYFVSFFGVLFAGGVPVPIYPPTRPKLLKDHINRQTKIANNAKAVMMITIDEAIPLSSSMANQVQSIRRITTCANLVEDAEKGILPIPAPKDTAFIQYTSGSTGDPKGVVLSHENLISNIRAMGNFLQVGPDDVFVSWLPLYHDMGLIGAWLGSLTFGMPLIIMSPLSFLARPQRWLKAIDRYKGTISGAPNFAYEACLARIREQDIEGLDLSSWRVAFNGAEPVQPKTIEKFCDKFGAHGFDCNSMMPVYGLAENSVGLAFPTPGTGPKFDRINKIIINKSKRAVPADSNTPENDVLNVPSCGQPLPGHQIRVVDGTGEEVPERCQGLIQFQGPSSTSGYYRNKSMTKKLFDGYWRNSGDLGYLANGQVFILGREKDVIIRGGRNIYPSELEAAIGTLDGIQLGNVAVFGSPDPETGFDRLIVMAETRIQTEERILNLNKSIMALSSDLTGIGPDEIVLGPPRSVPKTSSGKVRRHAAQALYEMGITGELTIAEKWQSLMLPLNGVIHKCHDYYQTMLSWTYATYVWLTVIFLAPTVWLVVTLGPSIGMRWTFLKKALATLLYLTGIRLSVEGKENLNSEEPVIFVANHASYIDGAVLICSLPERLRFVAKAELQGNFFSRLFLTKLNTFFVERFDAKQSIKDSTRITDNLLDEGNLVYFPEGTFTRMPGLLPFHMGAFTASVDTGVPIIPIVLRGTRSILRDGTKLPRLGSVNVKILEPISRKTGSVSDRWRNSLSIRDQVREIILTNCAEPDLSREMVFPVLSNKRINHG